jgi:hypothetical protein
MGLRALRYADLVILALALPLALVAGLPIIGWAGATAAWLAQRGIHAVLSRRAAASDDLRTVAGLLTGSMIGRAWLVALSIFGVGMIEREAGLFAAVLSIAVFTVYFTTHMALRPFEPKEGGR